MQNQKDFRNSAADFCRSAKLPLLKHFITLQTGVFERHEVGHLRLGTKAQVVAQERWFRVADQVRRGWRRSGHARWFLS